MLNGDLHVKNEATTAKSRSKRKAKDEQESNAFHFIAFVPIDGKLWKLDGLERQPYNLGRYSTLVTLLWVFFLQSQSCRYCRHRGLDTSGETRYRSPHGQVR